MRLATVGALGAALLLLAMAPDVAAQSPQAQQIRRLAEPGSTEWADGVEYTLTSAFDRNGSGTIDTRIELALVTCDVWQALEDRYAGMLEIYGFAPGYIWVGYAFGFDESLRETAYQEAYRCISTRKPGAGGGNAGSGGGGSLADRVAAVGNADYASWSSGVRALIVPAYDRNGSGTLDTAAEVDAVACDVWQGVERAYAAGDYDQFWVGAGFKPDLIWNAEGLGFTEAARAPGWAAIQRCLGLGGATTTTASTGANSPYVAERLSYINDQFAQYNEYGTSWAVDEGRRTWRVYDEFGYVEGDLATSEVRLDGTLLGIFCTSGGACLRTDDGGTETSYTMGLNQNGRPIPHLDAVERQFREIRAHLAGSSSGRK